MGDTQAPATARPAHGDATERPWGELHELTVDAWKRTFERVAEMENTIDELGTMLKEARDVIYYQLAHMDGFVRRIDAALGKEGR